MSKFTLLIAIALLIAFWIFLNPRERFGYSTIGVTTYNALPIPYFDLIIHSDGTLSFRKEKVHFISLNESRELLNETPNFLIIGTGYSNKVKVDPNLNSTPVQVEIISTPQALKRFNQLKDEGKNVSAIICTT